MKVLLLNGSRKSTRSYKSLLKKWDIELVEKKVDLSRARWRDNKLTSSWLAGQANDIQAKYGTDIAIVQFLFDEDDWENNTRGTHYGTPYSGYEITAVKERKDWEDTGLHELMHAFEDFTYTYLGQKLAPLVKAKDWDEGVVHGKEKGFKEYEYDKSYKAVKKHVFEADKKRKAGFSMGIAARTVVRQIAGGTVS